MTKTALERVLNTEVGVHLGHRTEPAAATDNPTPGAPTTNAPEAPSAAPKNRRNGHSRKTARGRMGDLQLRTPRDRNGTFLKYVADSDSRDGATGLGTIDPSAAVLEAEGALETFAAKRDAKYPTVATPWRRKWADVITRSEFPEAIRKAIDTTNGIESASRAIRELTRNREQDPSAESALQRAYLAIHAAKEWAVPTVGWKAALNHFAIVFGGRMPTRPES